MQQTATSVLVPLDSLKVKQELQLVSDKPAALADVDPVLAEQARKYADQLLSADPADFRAKQDRRDAVEGMGRDLQVKSSGLSQMLQQPIKTLAQRGADGGEVPNALVDLKVKVEELDPTDIDFSPGWFSRLLGVAVPVVGRRLKRYFSQYESAQTVVQAVIASLQKGQDQLRRDNVTLRGDQDEMLELTKKLERGVALGMLLDKELSRRIEDGAIKSDDPQRKFISEELLFPLRQRLIDLEQQLGVNQQGILTIELIVRNNQELIRGVDRAQNVTVTALNVAVAVALALANQKIVLDKIEAVNTTTSNLMRGTAARLKTQGVEVHKQASRGMLDMQALKDAFGDIHAALEDISTFRQQALPEMAKNILELDNLTRHASVTIQRMQDGNRARPEITIEVQ